PRRSTRFPCCLCLASDRARVLAEPALLEQPTVASAESPLRREWWQQRANLTECESARGSTVLPASTDAPRGGRTWLASTRIARRDIRACVSAARTTTSSSRTFSRT